MLMAVNKSNQTKHQTIQTSLIIVKSLKLFLSLLYLFIKLISNEVLPRQARVGCAFLSTDSNFHFYTLKVDAIQV